MTNLRSFVDRAMGKATALGHDTAVVADGGWCAPFQGKPYKWGEGVTLPRSLVAATATPTTQETADRAASAAAWRSEGARREVVRAEWFTAVLEAAGPVAAAILEEHVPDDDGDCSVDSGGYPSTTWPCRSVLVAARFCGVPVPEDLW